MKENTVDDIDEQPETSGSNLLGLQDIHHVEMYVGDARHTAEYFKQFGFSPIAYSGLETGVRDRTSFTLAQGKVRLLITSALSPDSKIARHAFLHGDSVRDIAFGVEDVDHAYNEAVDRGATVVKKPHDISDSEGKVRKATISHGHGDVEHSFVARENYGGVFLPGFAPRLVEVPSVGITGIDHIVTNVFEGQMDSLANWYERVMGFVRTQNFDPEDIDGAFSRLMSVVLGNDKFPPKFPINEPVRVPGSTRGNQISEFLEFNVGPGIQHIAFHTDDAIQTVSQLVRNGVEFLDSPPAAYYENLPEIIGTIEEVLEQIQELGILVDRDADGYLLQIFTRLITARPTLFLEIIQRRGSRGFGIRNFRTLFEAIEREQEKRGN